jgi:hypothetical protein
VDVGPTVDPDYRIAITAAPDRGSTIVRASVLEWRVGDGMAVRSQRLHDVLDAAATALFSADDQTVRLAADPGPTRPRLSYRIYDSNEEIDRDIAESLRRGDDRQELLALWEAWHVSGQVTDEQLAYATFRLSAAGL